MGRLRGSDQPTRRFSIGLIPIVALLVLSVRPAVADCENWVARLVSVEGRVDVRTGDQVGWRPVTDGELYCGGERLRVAANARATVELFNDTVLRLDQKTLLLMPEREVEHDFWVRLRKGALHLISRVKRGLEIRTPYVNAGLEGTEFVVRVLDEESVVAVIEGTVSVSNPQGRLLLADGQAASARSGQPPVMRLDIRPSDAVHWALHYPTVIDPESTAAAGVLMAAQRLLSKGQADQADQAIAEVLTTNPDDVQALSLRAVIALAQNDKALARRYAEDALTKDEGSGTANFAMSYVQQAEFDLEAAKTSVERVLEAEPENALAWARLAELSASLGDLDKSLQAAEQAVSIDPSLSRTQMVLGFAYLMRIELDDAEKAFREAIRLDSSEPLARLGLGLLKIRRGNLAEGRRDLEIAVSLDPNNSLVRSYLGKAYFEEKRDEEASVQYELAKELDSQDPTPWLYSAFLKQSQNNPMLALRALQRSIALNGGRAVYRSRLLLDQDLASRNVSQARLYKKLGLERTALLSGWKSLQRDPSNYSAHRFLADAYQTLPRHEVARVSELLQAQLLQPLSSNSIQPQLSQSDLGIIDAVSSALTFSDLGRLYLRDGITFQSNLLFGNNDTEGAEFLFSGIKNRFAFSAGLFRFRTEGFHSNNDQDQLIRNLFLQTMLSHRTSVQAEIRTREIEKGEPIRFDPTNFDPTLRDDDKSTSYRVGLRHAFSPRSIIIGSLLYQQEDLNRTQFFGFFTETREVDSRNLELRHIYSANEWSLSTGISHVKTDAEVSDSFFGVSDNTTRHTTFYTYFNKALTDSFSVSVGASTDSLNNDALDLSEVNGKFGFNWQVMPSTDLRAAYTEVMSKIILDDRTLENVTFSGFNQFFDDEPGTVSRLYSIAIDHEFTTEWLGGMEWSKRDLSVPSIDEFGVTRIHDWREEHHRAYLYWNPSKEVAVSVEYFIEDFERSPDFTGDDRFVESKVRRVPIRFGYIHPSGFAGRLTATYLDQDGVFQNFAAPDITNIGSDSAWIFDAKLEYRLPKRLGAVSIGIQNIFDKQFDYQETDARRPIVSPDRFIYGQAYVAF